MSTANASTAQAPRADSGTARDAARQLADAFGLPSPDLSSLAGSAAPSLDGLGKTLKQAGMRLTRFRGTLDQALEFLRHGAALVALHQGRFVVLAARQSAGELAAQHELRGQVGEADWGVVEPVLPDDGIAGPPPGGHGHGDGEGGHEHHPQPLARLWGLLRPEWVDLWTVVLFALGIGVLSLAVPITVEALVSTVQGGNTAMFQAVIVLTCILLFCLGLATAMRGWQTWVVEYIQRRLFTRIVNELAYRLPRVAVRAFDRQHGPELVNRFFDILTVQKAGGTLLLDGLSVIVQGFVGLAVLAAWHPWLLGFDFALVLGCIFLFYVLGWNGVSTKITESYAKYAVAGWLEEMVRHPLAFKQPAGQDYGMERADLLTRQYLEARQDSFSVLFRQVLFGLILQAVASAALLGIGGWLVIKNELNLGQLVAAELLVVVTIGSLVKLSKSVESYYDLMAALDKVGQLVDLPQERARGEAAVGTGPARLEVSQVSYHYEEFGHTTHVFNGLSFVLEPGERVALAGPSGSGKGTLVELLYGLREPVSGAIRLDGVDLRDLALASLREQVVSVGEAEVFDGTVLENVRLNRERVTVADVREALAATGLLGVVQALPQGMHTQLSTGGAPLTGSQAARLMIARAIAGKPRLLIIDRILDVIGPELRREVLPALVGPDAPWTLLLVSHDPEVLAACSRVLTLPPLPNR